MILRTDSKSARIESYGIGVVTLTNARALATIASNNSPTSDRMWIGRPGITSAALTTGVTNGDPCCFHSNNFASLVQAHMCGCAHILDPTANLATISTVLYMSSRRACGNPSSCHAVSNSCGHQSEGDSSSDSLSTNPPCPKSIKRNCPGADRDRHTFPVWMSP